MVSINPGDTGTATSTAGAATINHTGGVITTEALTTGAGSDYSFTLTNNCITASSNVIITVGNGTNSTTPYDVHSVQPAAGSVTFKINNGNGSATAFNGTLKIYFTVI